MYGSDALAGVVNIILRKDYAGVEARVGAGTSQDGGASEYSAQINAGYGELGKDKFNVFGVLSVYDREMLHGGQRDFSKNPDQTSRGGYDNRSPTGNPGVWQTAGKPGYTDNTVFPACPQESRGVFASDGKLTCFYNFAADNPLLPKTQRVGLYGRGTLEINPDLLAFAEIGLNKNTTYGSSAPTPGGAALPVGHVSNPYPFAVNIRYRYTEVGPRLNEIETDASRVLLALQGNHLGWSWETGYSQSKSESVNTGTNYISQTALVAAVPSYNFADISKVPQSVIDGLRIVTKRTGESDLKSFDFKASRDLFKLAGGTAALAWGFDYREESLADTPDENIRKGNVVGSGGTSSAGSRESNGLYAELALPLFKGFEAQVAVRRDDYSDFGTATTPKFAMSYKPSDRVMIRTGYGKGFRAPSLVQLFQGESISFPQIRDVVRCDAYTAAFNSGTATAAERSSACGVAQVRNQVVGNADLDAEKSESIHFGLVFDVTKDLSVGVDYWNYKHRAKIDSLTSSYILRNADALSAELGRPVVNRFDPSARDLAVGSPGALRGTGADTAVGFVNTYFNTQRQATSGADFDFNYRFSMGEWGRARLNSVLTYVDSFKRETAQGTGMLEYVNSYQYPRWRATTVFTVDRGPWAFTLVNRYVDSYEQYYAPPSDTAPSRVKENIMFDAQVQYSGIKNVTLTAGGLNIFNKEPPFANYDWYGYDSSNTDPRGAFWYVRASYKF